MKLKNNKENVEIYDNNLLVGKIPNSIFELLKVYFKNYDNLEIIGIFDKIFNGNGEKIKKILYILNNSVFIKNEINLKYIIDFCDKYAEFLDFNSALIRSDLLINYDTSYVSNNFNKMYKYRLYSSLILTIRITDSCNSKCVYCYARSFYQNRNIFSTDPYCKKSKSTLKIF